MVKKAISIFIVVQALIVSTLFISSAFFTNVEVAFLSAFFIIVGSAFAYKKMVHKQVSSDTYEEKRDLLDTIEDPHELYEETPINEAPIEELNLKEIVKEERGKIKTFNLSSMKHGARGSISLFRLIPYLFLILGFIALKNNGILDLSSYLPTLLVGIVVGSIISKEMIA